MSVDKITGNDKIRHTPTTAGTGQEIIMTDMLKTFALSTLAVVAGIYVAKRVLPA